jgi:LysM repeat protein
MMNTEENQNKGYTITFRLPVAIGLMALFLAIGALLVYVMLRPQNVVQSSEPVVEITGKPTPTLTITPPPTPSVTSQPAVTPTTMPTLTPFLYTVKTGETCGQIAHAFDISVQSIVLGNDLPVDCPVYEGQELRIPHPTPTSLPPPTPTLVGTAKAIAECEKVIYTVKEGDTLSSIAQNYGVSMAAIKVYNEMSNNTVFAGMGVIIPLCERGKENVTPEPTLPPPYPALDLLRPTDGQYFTANTVTLQWASVGILGENEAYLVTVEDLTGGESRKLRAYVEGTSYQIERSFRHTVTEPHAYRWWVVPVRRTDTDQQGAPIWTTAGEPSTVRIFIWAGRP